MSLHEKALHSSLIVQINSFLSGADVFYDGFKNSDDSVKDDQSKKAFKEFGNVVNAKPDDDSTNKVLESYYDQLKQQSLVLAQNMDRIGLTRK